MGSEPQSGKLGDIDEFIKLVSEGVDDEVPSGWKDIVLTMLHNLRPYGTQVNMFQIKEKLGGLRVYYSSSVPAPYIMNVDDIVRDAECKAAVTCQYCGEGGASCRNIRGWLSTLCDKCALRRSDGIVE